jgi:RNA polymerase sigma-70 factor (ECF subfamily)
MTDTARFEAFVREYEDMVYGTAVRLLANPSEAEDVAQTVFLKAFERFESIGASPAAAGWLKTVATNLCLNHLSRYPRGGASSTTQAAGMDDAAQSDHIDGLLARGGRTGTNVAAVLRRCPGGSEQQEQLERRCVPCPTTSVPLVLFHFEGRAYQEIAALLGVTLAKVKTDIHRGREALKQALVSHHAAR